MTTTKPAPGMAGSVMPPQTIDLYIRRQTPAALRIQRPDNRIATIPRGRSCIWN
ncbi:MAG: hypothetical protein J0H18_18195 [Rhizobiales bacterium]|nr:hypothetical protein [Hyphomicrobiales bacterium]